MITVFIAGSITIKHLDSKVKERINNIVDSGFHIIIGDANGVDALSQEYLSQLNYRNVTIYCSGVTPRNNIGFWDFKHVETFHKEGTRGFFTAKDIEMAKDSDFGLMIWDAQSTGTLKNIIELLGQHKKTVVFLNREKQFYNVCTPNDIDFLVSNMTESAKIKADQKINLFSHIEKTKLAQSEVALQDNLELATALTPNSTLFNGAIQLGLFP